MGQTRSPRVDPKDLLGTLGDPKIPDAAAATRRMIPMCHFLLMRRDKSGDRCRYEGTLSFRQPRAVAGIAQIYSFLGRTV